MYDSRLTQKLSSTNHSAITIALRCFLTTAALICLICLILNSPILEGAKPPVLRNFEAAKFVKFTSPQPVLEGKRAERNSL